MSTSSIVWIDREHAKIYLFSDDRMERRQVRAHFPPDHHTHRKEDSAEHESPAFYDEVAKTLASSGGILIVGPGVARTHFQSYLQEKYPATSKRVLACEAVDHPSDHQIAAMAIRYFRSQAG